MVVLVPIHGWPGKIEMYPVHVQHKWPYQKFVVVCAFLLPLTSDSCVSWLLVVEPHETTPQTGD
jgi:hypothetical protein